MNKKHNPQEVKSEKLTIRLKESAREKLQLLAENNGLSQGNVLRSLLENAKTSIVLKKDL